MHEHVWEFGTWGRCIQDNCGWVRPEVDTDFMENIGQGKGIRIPLWLAVIVFSFICLGAVVSVSWLYGQLEKTSILKVKSEIVMGIQDKHKFTLIGTPLVFTPTGNNTAKITIRQPIENISIAGAGDNTLQSEGK